MHPRLTIPGTLLAACLGIRGFAFASEWSPWVATLWFGAAALCLVRVGWGAPATVALTVWAITTGHYYNHVLFMFWIALTIVLFQERNQQRFVMRCQLSVVYGFAALAKINPAWLSGDALEGNGIRLPDLLIEPTAVLAVMAEATVAFLLWLPRWRPVVLMIATPMHLSFWLLMGNNVVWSPGLLPFNLLALGILAWSTVPARPSPRPQTAHV